MDATVSPIPYENQMEHYFEFIMKLISDFSFGPFINDDPIIKSALFKCLLLMHDELFGREYDNVSIYTVGKFTRELIGEDVSLLKKCDEKRVCFEFVFIMMFNFIHKAQIANEMYENVDAMLKKYPEFKNLCPYETNKLFAFCNVMKVALRVVPAKNHKNHVLDIVTRITEGREVKYVTGSGQTQATARRVQIYELEGDIKPQPRPPRKICLKTKQLCNQSCKSSSSSSNNSNNNNNNNNSIDDIENIISDNSNNDNNDNNNSTSSSSSNNGNNSGCCSSSSSSAHTSNKDANRNHHHHNSNSSCNSNNNNNNNNNNKRSYTHTVIAYEESDLFDIDNHVDLDLDLDLGLDLGLDLDLGMTEWNDDIIDSSINHNNNIHDNQSNKFDDNNNNNNNTSNNNNNNNTNNNNNSNNKTNNRKALLFRSLSIDDLEDFCLQSASKLPRSCDGCSSFEKCHTHGLAHVQEQEDWLNILASGW